MYGGYRAVLQEVADKVLDGRAPQAMAQGMAGIDKVAAELAPKETTALARSGRVRVYDGGQVVHDSGPTSTPTGGRRGRQRGRGGGRRGGNRGRR